MKHITSHEMSQLKNGLELQRLEAFQVHTLVVESRALKGNPWGDPHLRRNPVLVPRGEAPDEGWPVVLVLAGFTGNGPNYFNLKAFESNFPEVVDRALSRGEAPRAVYVFCDAMTYWGGSQFINSEATGRYEDYVAGELIDAVKASLPVSSDSKRWCVMGGSSGGYGALHLSSRFPERFALCAAIAPDSFFEASLLKDLYIALPVFEKVGGVAGIHAEKENGRLMKRREAHAVLNVVAMGLCYAPQGPNDIDLPLDSSTGVLIPEVWAKWKRHDPVVFLRERRANVARLAGIWLDVGTRDEHHLQYGARQIRDVLRELGAPVDYSEFDGTHRDIGDRRPLVWKWLKGIWG